MRWAAAAGVAVLVAVLAAAGPSTSDDPTGPAGSSYAFGEGGAAAYAELLEEYGHDVRRLRRPLADASLRPGDVVVVFGATRLDRLDREALRAFVRTGGRVVASGPADATGLDSLFDARPVLGRPSGDLARVLASVNETVGVEAVAAPGTRRWAQSGSLQPVLGDTDTALVLVADVEEGRVQLLSGGEPLYNGSLAEADNALLGVNLAGEPAGTVYFVEYIHGYPARRGLAALPDGWRWTLAGLLLAVFVWMVAKARRLGPPIGVTSARIPPRMAYVDGVATTLRRTKQPRESLAPLRAEARRRLERRAGLPAGAPAEALAAAGARFGLEPRDVMAVLDPADDDQGIVAAGEALTKLAADHHRYRDRQAGGSTET